MARAGRAFLLRPTRPAQIGRAPRGEPGPVAVSETTEIPLEWSFGVATTIQASTWTGDDDDRWQIPLQWSFLIDLDPVDDVEDPA